MWDQKLNDREIVVANAYIKSEKDTHTNTLETKNRRRKEKKEKNEKKKTNRPMNGKIFWVNGIFATFILW